jgi:hypothetical protein
VREIRFASECWAAAAMRSILSSSLTSFHLLLLHPLLGSSLARCASHYNMYYSCRLGETRKHLRVPLEATRNGNEQETRIWGDWIIGPGNLLATDRRPMNTAHVPPCLQTVGHEKGWCHLVLHIQLSLRCEEKPAAELHVRTASLPLVPTVCR